MVNEVRYLAVATPDNGGVVQVLNHVYPVKKVELVKRSILTEKITGSRGFSNPNEKYWLFTLGPVIELPAPLQRSTLAHFEVLLTGLDELRSVQAGMIYINVTRYC